MASRLLSIYHRLPVSLRSVAATVRGYQLRRLRYGDDTESLVAEALKAETLPRSVLVDRQNERLKALLLHAAQNVSHYRRYWSGSDAKGRDPTRLNDWPILEKDAVRDDPQSFIADGIRTSSLVAEHTSGTTGKPLNLWWSREATRRHYALFEARWRRWYGVDRNDRWAILGGQLVAPVNQTKPPFWVWNAASQQLYLSAYHISPRFSRHYFDALLRYRVRYLWGYTSALYALAQDILHSGRDDLHMAVAITNAEPLLEHQREAISKAFHCPVRETYGMAELVACASECNAQRMHLWPETGIVEVINRTHAAAKGEIGDLVCTGLLNFAMPLIRYRVGDRGALDSDLTACACGRTLPRLNCIEGRKDDVLYTSDGRRIGRLDTVFKSDWPIREAQIVQDRLDRVTLHYVPAKGYSATVGQEMAAEVRRRLGDVEVVLSPTEFIARTSNGKFRAVICQLSDAERSKVSEQ